MIISCPSCATRYEVDDARFSPSGRSVRCAECDESWFVPAPEPIEDLVPLKSRGRDHDVRGHSTREDSRESGRDDSRDFGPDAARNWRDDAYEEEVDEPLFEAPNDARKERDYSSKKSESEKQKPRFRFGDDREDSRAEKDFRGAEKSAADESKADLLPPRDEKGRFIRTKKQAAEEKRQREEAEARAQTREFGRSGRREEASREFVDRKKDADREYDNSRDRGRHERRPDRFSSEEGDHREQSDYRDKGRRRPRDDDRDFETYAPSASRYADDTPRAERNATIVDADFEDVGRPRDFYEDDEPVGRGFGRKVREERRRATALARMEDLEPIAERVFNDEFFAALRVQPKELERAIRKARRRAEAREKNRLTPLRALGWSAWIGAVTAFLFVAYAYRDNIVAMFPNTADAYEAVGIEANPYGLKIEGVTHRVAMSTDGPVIEILGRLRNGANADVAPPMLQAEAIGIDGNVLSRWTFAARADKVAKGSTVDFSTRAAAPEGVNEVVLSFAPAEGVKVSVGDLLKAPTN
jgi:predicted Zn finger-like uncharacterized protein